MEMAFIPNSWPTGMDLWRMRRSFSILRVLIETSGERRWRDESDWFLIRWDVRFAPARAEIFSTLYTEVEIERMEDVIQNWTCLDEARFEAKK